MERNTAKMIRPHEVTDAMLTSSIAEDDHPQWAAGTAYSVGAQVVREHVVYKAVQASTGVDPATDSGTNWSRGLATNRWKPFDRYLQDRASAPGSATWTIAPAANTTGVALFGISARTARVTMTDSADGTVYDRTIELLNSSGVANYVDWFFKPAEFKTQVVLTDLPPYAAPVSIELTAPNDTVRIGQIVIGFVEGIGTTLNGAGIGINDYSRKEADAFGRVAPVERGYSDKFEPVIAIDTARIGYITGMLAARRATPTVYAFDSRWAESDYAVYGYYDRFRTAAVYADVTELSITINGLT